MQDIAGRPTNRCQVRECKSRGTLHGTVGLRLCLQHLNELECRVEEARRKYNIVEHTELIAEEEKLPNPYPFTEKELKSRQVYGFVPNREAACTKCGTRLLLHHLLQTYYLTFSAKRPR
jgi:hypothetical protein